MMDIDEVREGEIRLAEDPGSKPGDAHIVFIGRIETPWITRDDCPKNVRRARETGETATLRLDPEYRPGLTGLAQGQAIVILYWLGAARRDLILQAPRHADGVRGTFALRSPVRPNPIGLATARILRLDMDAGEIEVEGLDCMNGTALIDIKPHLETVDVPAVEPNSGEAR